MPLTLEQQTRLLLLEADFAATRAQGVDCWLLTPLTPRASAALSNWWGYTIIPGQTFVQLQYQIQWWQRHYNCKVVAT